MRRMGLFDAEDWAFLGKELGLERCLATAGYAQGMGFRQLRRTFGGPAPAKPSYAHRLYGRWRGTEVVVLCYDVGSGSTQTTYTGVVARVDPPLFLGLELKAKSFLHGLFGADGISLGAPVLDKALLVEGFTPGAIRAFFSPTEPRNSALLDGILRAASTGLVITDSTVDLSTQGTVTDPRRIGAWLDQAVWIARALSVRRAEVPPTRPELAQQGEWLRFADAAGFAFSPERMKLTGTAAGSAIEVALESEPARVCTSVSVRFPTPVGFGFAVRRTNLPSFLQGIFSQDIRVGHARFDDLYVVTGNPEHRVRELLGRAPVPHILAELGEVSREVQMHHEGLFFRLEGAFPTGDAVGALIERGRLATTALFGEVSALGPYR